MPNHAHSHPNPHHARCQAPILALLVTLAVAGCGGGGGGGDGGGGGSQGGGSGPTAPTSLSAGNTFIINTGPIASIQIQSTSLAIITTPSGAQGFALFTSASSGSTITISLDVSDPNDQLALDLISADLNATFTATSSGTITGTALDASTATLPITSTFGFQP